MAFLGRNYARIRFTERKKSWQGWQPPVSPIKQVDVSMAEEPEPPVLSLLDVEAYPLSYGGLTSDVGAGLAASKDGVWTWTNALTGSAANAIMYAPNGGAMRRVFDLTDDFYVRYCVVPGAAFVAERQTLLTLSPQGDIIGAQDMGGVDLPSPIGETYWSDPEDPHNLSFIGVGYVVAGEHLGKYIAAFAVFNALVPIAGVISEPFSPGEPLEMVPQLFRFKEGGGSETYSQIPDFACFAVAYPDSDIMVSVGFEKGYF